MTIRPFVVATAAFALSCTFPAFPQGRGGGDWATAGADAQRSGSVRTDAKISTASLSKPGFQLLWNAKLRNDARQGAGLAEPTLIDRFIGHRGFRSYAFVAGSGDNVFAVDTDLSRIDWQKHFPLAPAAGTAACPGGMMTPLVRSVSSAIAAPGDGRGGGGGGRGGPAKSGVGEPLQGAVTLQSALAPAAGRAAAGPGRGPGMPNANTRPRRLPNYVYAVSSDGAFHSMYLGSGEEPDLPVKFLPANARATGLIIVDDAAYAVTTGNCGGAPNGIWALDIAAKSVASMKADVVGAPAFGPDGTVYITTGAGDLVALEPKTLARKASYAAGQAFATPAVVFLAKEKPMVAAATKDGSILVLDAALSSVTARAAGKVSGQISTWQDPAGNRWLFAPSGRAVAAFKLNGSSLEAAWTSREIANPAAAAVVNGVLFTAAQGSPAAHATLYALDAATGKEYWSSGNAITSYLGDGSGLSIGGGAVYLGTRDGSLWAFGFPIEH